MAIRHERHTPRKLQSLGDQTDIESGLDALRVQQG